MTDHPTTARPLDAIWRVRQEPEDGSWTITDDLRPGFVTSGETLQDAVEDLLPVMALWDETNASRSSHNKEAAALPAQEPLAVERVAEWLHKNAATRRAISCGPESKGCRQRHRMDARDLIEYASALQGAPR